MAKLTKRAAIKAIVQAYRNDAYILIALPLEQNSRNAKRNVRRFGPITNVDKKNGETLYVYRNERERVHVTQFVTKNIRSPKTDTKKPEPKNITATRKKEIEKAMVRAYKDNAQFMIAYPPVNNREQAKQRLRFFGTGEFVTNNGIEQYVIDDIENQVQVVVDIA